METAMEEEHTTETATTAMRNTTMAEDPQPSYSEEEGAFPQQMGSGRRDARVVCETFTAGRDLNHGKTSDFQHNMHSNAKGTQRNSKHLKRRGFAYAHSRNPLLACFIGESVLSSRAIRLHPNSDSASSQKAFFSLIPVDDSSVNERTGEPTSPQLSCIGQVKCRQAKGRPRGNIAGTIVDDLAQLDLACDRKEWGAAAGLGRLGTRSSIARTRSFDFAAAIADIPPLDLNDGGGADCPRLMRSVKRPSNMDFSSSRKGRENEKEQQTVPMSPTTVKHSVQHFNHLLKQLLGASMMRTRFICGWNSRDSSTQGDDIYSRDDEEKKDPPMAEHYEIDLSRFAACDMQANTPSFRDSRDQMGRKLADIRVRSREPSAVAAREGSRIPEENDRLPSGPEEDGEFAGRTIVIKVERRNSSSETTLWKRRCMDRPLSLEVRR